MTDQTVLEEAAGLINGDRQEQYGNATESHTRIADLWAAYLNTDVTEFDVVNMMVLLKVSRTRNTYHRDSYVDIAGYAGLGERLFNESVDLATSVDVLTKEFRNRRWVDGDGWTFEHFSGETWHATKPQHPGVAYEYTEPIGINWAHPFEAVA